MGQIEDFLKSTKSIKSLELTRTFIKTFFEEITSLTSDNG